MKSAKANHLTGKSVIESHAHSVTLFLPLSVAICRDANWCINASAKHLLEKKRQSDSIWQAGLVPHLRNWRALAYQKSTSALKAWSYFRATELHSSRNDGGLLHRLGTITFLTLP